MRALTGALDAVIPIADRCCHGRHGSCAGSGAIPSIEQREFVFSKYPSRALAVGEQGAVRFRADVDKDGNVLGCKVVEGSGFQRLDNETCELIVNHARFKPTLDEGGRARPASHEGIVNWRIPGAVARPKKAGIGGRSPDEIVCKRVTKTGSRVLGSRVCMTRREWIASAENYQDDWGSLQGRRGYSVCGGPNLPPC